MSFVSLCVCACFCHCFCVFLCVCLFVSVCFSVGFCLFLCVSVCLWLPCVKQEQMHFAKPLYLPLQIFALFKTVLVFGLLGKNPNENQRAIAAAGRVCVCLFLCVFL